MLGIMIGVGAVIVLVAVGNGSSKQVEDRIDRLGTNTLTVLPAASSVGAADRANQSRNTQLHADGRRRPRTTPSRPDVRPSRPSVSGQADARLRRARRYQPGQIIGTTADLRRRHATTRSRRAAFFADQRRRPTTPRSSCSGRPSSTSLFPGHDPVGADREDQRQPVHRHRHPESQGLQRRPGRRRHRVRRRSRRCRTS